MKKKKHLGKHRLDLLWQDLKAILSSICEATGQDMPAADIEGIDSYIRQLSALDPDSFSFRYTHSKPKKGDTSLRGDPSLPPELTHINLRHFAEMMERLADYLDGIDEETSQLFQGKAEMESEWRNDMAHYMDDYED